jgi:hypothetical protein
MVTGLGKTVTVPKRLACWYFPVIPASQEVEVGGLWAKAHPAKSTKSYLKNKLNAKGLEEWLR